MTDHGRKWRAETGPATINLRGEAPDAASSVAETYFRDKRSATFVEEVLGVVTPPGPGPARSRRGWLAAGLAVVALAGGGGAWRALRVPSAPPAAPVVVAPAVPPPPPAPISPAPAPTPPIPSPAAAGAPAPSGATDSRRRRVTERRAAAAPTGQIVIQCTPCAAAAQKGDSAQRACPVFERGRARRARGVGWGATTPAACVVQPDSSRARRM